MADHLNTGRKGETIASAFLAEKGYQILETNYRFSRAEIDIIAKKAGVLVFIEVKTRSTDFFGEPELSIDEHKKRLLAEAASAYMEAIGHDWEFRFDIISIILTGAQNFRLKHFEDAFFPGLF